MTRPPIVSKLTAVLGLLLVSGARDVAVALEALPVTHAEAVERADAIVRGRVIARETRWNAQRTLPITSVTLAVDESLKGAAEDRVTLEFAGGDIDGRFYTVSDLPIPAEGSEIVAFCYEGRGTAVSPIVGANQWYFELVSNSTTPEAAVLVDHQGRTLVGLGEGRPLTVRDDRTREFARTMRSAADVKRPTHVAPSSTFDATGRPTGAPRSRAVVAPREAMTWDEFRAVTLERIRTIADGGAR